MRLHEYHVLVTFDRHVAAQRVRDALLYLVARETTYQCLYIGFLLLQPLANLRSHILIARLHDQMIDCFHARWNR